MDYTDLYVEKYRPKTLDEMVLDPAIKKYFKDIFDSQDPVIPNLLFRGKPGGGKTTLARIIQHTLGWETLVLNASEENGVDTMRDKVVTFCQTVSLNGKMKLVILEEADGLSSSGGNGSSAQELLKNLIETSSKYVRFILLVNNISKIDAPIKSRMQEFEIVPPNPNENNDILKYIVTIIAKEGISVPNKDDVRTLVKTNYPDIRKTLQILQQSSFNDRKEFHLDSISDNDVDSIVSEIFSVFRKNASNKDLMETREHYIEKERVFSSDYMLLMRKMFDRVANRNPTSKEAFVLKLDFLKTIQEFMYKHAFVVDKEINFFSLIVTLLKMIM